MSNRDTKSSLLDVQLVEIPDNYLCPITRQIFNNPYITKYGHIFEKSAIQEWLSANNTCPLTRQPLDWTTDIYPVDKAIIDEISTFVKDNKLYEYVFKIGCIENIISFIEEYNNMLSQSDDINELYYIKDIYMINKHSFTNIKHHHSIILELINQPASVIVPRYDVINYYFDIIIQFCEFELIRGAETIYNIRYNIMIYQIYKYIIVYYDKLITNYDTLNLLVSKKEICSRLANLVLLIEKMRCDTINPFLSRALKGEQNTSKTHFSKSVQNSHTAQVSMKYYYIKLINRGLKVEFNRTITTLYYYYKELGCLERLTNLINECVNLEVDTLLNLNELIELVENENIKNYLQMLC